MDIEAQVSPPEPVSPLWMRIVFGKNPAWTVARVLTIIFAAVVLFKFVLLPVRVTGNSMAPTIRDGQIKFVNKLAYRRHPPRRGDIVAVAFAGKEVLLLKRIVALPGETFIVRKGDIYINGEKLAEPYAHGKITMPGTKNVPGNSLPEVLGEDEYMVIGDNRPVSEFFRRNASKIIGKVL